MASKLAAAASSKPGIPIADSLVENGDADRFSETTLDYRWATCCIIGNRRFTTAYLSYIYQPTSLSPEPVNTPPSTAASASSHAKPQDEPAQRLRPLAPRSKLFNPIRSDYPNITLFSRFLDSLTTLGAEWTLFDIPTIATKYSQSVLCPVLANSIAVFASRFIPFSEDEERMWLGSHAGEARETWHRMDLEYFRMAKLSMDAGFMGRRTLETLYVFLLLSWSAHGVGDAQVFCEFGEVGHAPLYPYLPNISS
jgi:hypothetical protein